MKPIFLLASLILINTHSFGQDPLIQLKNIESEVQSPDWRNAFISSGNPMPNDLKDIIDKWKSASEALSVQFGNDQLYADINQIVESIKVKLTSFKGKKRSDDADVRTYSEIRGLFLQFDYARTILSIDLILKKVEGNLNQRIANLDTQLSSRISKVDRLIYRLDARIETLKKDIVWENKAFMMPNLALINMKLDQIQKKQSYTHAAVNGQGSIYAGVHLFTGQAVGFTVQYLKPSTKTIGLVLGPSVFYRKVDQTEQFGIGVSLGPSIRFRNTYRLSILGEASLIGSEPLAGGRVMAYNRFMAVGVGYTSLLGTGVSILITLR